MTCPYENTIICSDKYKSLSIQAITVQIYDSFIKYALPIQNVLYVKTALIKRRLIQVNEFTEIQFVKATHYTHKFI